MACPLLCSESCYSGPRLHVCVCMRVWFCLTQTERPRPLCCQSAPGAVPVVGPWSLFSYCFFFLFFSFFFKFGRLLAQFELEGGDLHGIQAEGGVVGQRRAGVHQGQWHGLEQLQVQVLEESRYAQLQRNRRQWCVFVIQKWRTLISWEAKEEHRTELPTWV